MVHRPIFHEDAVEVPTPARVAAVHWALLAFVGCSFVYALRASKPTDSVPEPTSDRKLCRARLPGDYLGTRLPDEDSSSDRDLVKRARIQASTGGSPSASEPLMETQAYLVDNSVLNANSRGLGYRLSKNIEDRAPQGIHEYWNTVVNGIQESDGWVRVGDRFLPMQLGGVTVLKLREPQEAGAGLPDLSGRWQLMKVDGEADTLMSEFGLSAILRVAQGRPRQGRPRRQEQEIVQVGNAFQIRTITQWTQWAFQEHTVKKFLVDAGEQTSRGPTDSDDVLLQPRWSGQVLVIEERRRCGGKELTLSQRWEVQGEQLTLHTTSPKGTAMVQFYTKAPSD
jgi:hypothetical protein